jgi:hypothetical protein
LEEFESEYREIGEIMNETISNGTPNKFVSFFKKNIPLIIVSIYFINLLIPPSSHLLYALTIPFVVGGLFLIGMLGVVGLVRSRYKEEPANPTHKSFIFLMAVGFALSILSYIFFPLINDAYYHQKFDSKVWKDNAKAFDFDVNLYTPRQKMIDDLVDNVLPGLTRDEINDLLGDPDSGLLSVENESNIVYVLGPERGLGVDSQCLLISFDELGYFQKYEIYDICG